MILIYVKKLTPRISYVFDLLLTQLLQSPIQFTTDLSIYKAYQDIKINYGNQDMAEGIYFGAAHLLFENHIVKQDFDNVKAQDDFKLFAVVPGVLDFDPFASAFYLVTRYEEYLPHFKDNHGRYKEEDSIAFKCNFLGKPMVNIWTQTIKQIITYHYPNYVFQATAFTFNTTIDIDNAYAYKYKGLVKAISINIFLALQLQFEKLYDRLMVAVNMRQDPYDTYDKQVAIHQKYNIKPIYFILLGNKGKYDRNINHKNTHFVELIQRLATTSDIGMHPSYQAATNLALMKEEKKRLEQILSTNIRKSRSHYIKINIPETYRMLIDIGIEEDYSMGYPSYPGYRASIAHSFYFYDLEKEEKTILLVHPFVVMDTTLKKYLHIRAKDVLDYIYPLVQEAKDVCGNFIFIFHNESMGGSKMWKNWNGVYENIIQYLYKGKSSK
jgi:hypothetical protein